MRNNITLWRSPRGEFPNNRNVFPNGPSLFPKQTIKIMRVLALFSLLVLVPSCTVTKTVYMENIFNSWIGASAHDMILQQGTPTAIVPDGQGGQVYVYDNSISMTAGYSAPGQFYARPSGLAVPGNQSTSLSYQPGTTVSRQYAVTKKVEYFVNAAGYIYAWHSTGYPKTYKHTYTKKELAVADTTLFVPPAVSVN